MTLREAMQIKMDQEAAQQLRIDKADRAEAARLLAKSLAYLDCGATAKAQQNAADLVAHLRGLGLV